MRAGISTPLLASSLLSAVARQAAAQTPSVDGATVQRDLEKAVAAGAAHFALPAGDVRFNESSFTVVGARHMRIEGAGAGATTLWFAPGWGMRLVRSENVSVAGFAVDYDPLPYTQAKIVAISNVSGGKATYDLEMAPRSPDFSASCAPVRAPPPPDPHAHTLAAAAD